MARGLINGSTQVVRMCTEGMYRFVQCNFSNALIQISINLPFFKTFFQQKLHMLVTNK